MTLNNNILTEITTSTKTTFSTNMTYVDFGTGTTTPLPTDTVMETSVVRNARQDISTLSNSVIISGFLGTGQANGSAITEIGAFDAAAAGNMQDHALMTAVTKTAGKELWVDIRNNINITQGE